MANYPNFYENIDEARRRLEGTMVLYDGVPYNVLGVRTHRDGIFRVILIELNKPTNYPNELHEALNSGTVHDPFDWMARDKWMDTDAARKMGYYRKMINSPKFNRFRPFPLGMCNHRNDTYYLERMPERRVTQGLTYRGILETYIGLDMDDERDGNSRGANSLSIPWASDSIRDTIVGTYPTLEECVTNMINPKVLRRTVGFHRHFALLRGPLDMLFLAYKTNIVGLLPGGNLSEVILKPKTAFAKEAIESLEKFERVTVKR